MEPQSPTLPHEIELEILQRLPVKSLLRFRAVCKPWSSLVLDPNFIKMHLHQATNGDNINNQQRLIYLKSSREPLSVSINSIDAEASDKRVVQNLPFKENDIWSAKILCSCNGFVLIGIRGLNDIFLWNPSTGKYRKFSSRCFSYSGGLMLWGLGYDSSVDDYKVVRVLGYYEVKTIVDFFNFKSDSWTKIEKNDFPYKIMDDGQATVVNGAPHWVVSRDSTGLEDEEEFSIKRVIICFELKEEKFKEVSLPIGVDENLNFDIGVLGVYLCMAQNHHGSYFEISVMKEYGVKESWARLFVIPCSFNTLKPLFFTKNEDEVLMEVDRKECVVYNVRENTWTTILSTEKRWQFKVVSYVESLVSPTMLQYPSVWKGNENNKSEMVREAYQSFSI